MTLEKVLETSGEEFNRFDEICKIYEISKERLEEIIEKFPAFAGYDHKRVVKQATQVYENEKRVKEAILKFPPFAGLDHKRVVKQATQVYENEKRVKEAILKHPQFAGLDHKRVVKQATQVYENEKRVKEAILKHPPFAGYDHKRVVQEATQVYENEKRVKEAILKFPRFAGLDHKRVYRQKTRIGRLIGLSNEESIDIILNTSNSAGYSYRRDLARIDVVRTLRDEGVEITEDVKNWFINNYIKSPYVPNTRRRISHVDDGLEPPLLVGARRKFADQLNAI